MSTGSSERSDFRALAPDVSRTKAQSRLRRRRRWFPFRSAPLRLELIRLPVYIVEARFAPSEGDDRVAVRVAVDGLNGCVERLDRSFKLVSAARPGDDDAESATRRDGFDQRGGRSPAGATCGGRSRVEFPSEAGQTEAAEGLIVPPNLTAEEALSRARSELPWLSLHFALRRSVVYSLVDMAVSDRVGYPYWILHTVRRERRDFRAIDGISGRKLGSRGRSLVVQGYILLAKQEGTVRAPKSLEGN